MTNRYYCTKCGTTHSPSNEFYKSHLQYAIFPEEFNYPTVKELRQIARQLKQTANKILHFLTNLSPGHYRLYISSHSLKNVLTSLMKAKIRGKPTFTQSGDKYISENLGLIFEFSHIPLINCQVIDGFQICYERVGVVSKKETSKERKIKEAREIVSNIQSMIVFLWSVGIVPLTRTEHGIYKTILDKIKNGEITPRAFDWLVELQKMLKAQCYRYSSFSNLISEIIAEYDHYRPIIENLSSKYDIKRLLRAFARKLFYIGIKNIDEILLHLGYSQHEICTIFKDEVNKFYGGRCSPAVVFTLLIEPRPF